MSGQICASALITTSGWLHHYLLMTNSEQILNITPDTLTDAAHDLACEREARTLAWSKARSQVMEYKMFVRINGDYDWAVAGLLRALDEVERLEGEGV